MAEKNKDGKRVIFKFIPFTNYIKSIPVVCFLCLFLSHNIDAQKYLLIEKAGNPKTERIAMYDEIKFQLKDDDAGWYTRQIFDMDVNGQMLLLGNDWTPVGEISRLWLSRERTWVNFIGGALVVGGLSMFMTDAWVSISGDPEFTEGGMEFGLINMAVGMLMRWKLAPIKIRMDKNRRLRVVDLTF